MFFRFLISLYRASIQRLAFGPKLRICSTKILSSPAAFLSFIVSIAMFNSSSSKGRLRGFPYFSLFRIILLLGLSSCLSLWGLPFSSNWCAIWSGVTLDSPFALVGWLFNLLIRPHAFYYYVSFLFYLKAHAIYSFFPVQWHSWALPLYFWFVLRRDYFQTCWYMCCNCPWFHLIVQVYDVSYILLVCVSGICILLFLQRIHSVPEVVRDFLYLSRDLLRKGCEVVSPLEWDNIRSHCSL